MTTITFTFTATALGDGRHRINMFVKQLDPTYTESPGEEHRATKDARQIVDDIIARRKEQGDDFDQLLRDGEPPKEAVPVFMFAIGVTWDRGLKMAHYSRICHQRYLWEGRWTVVASMGMELFDYTMGVLRKRENAERREKIRKQRQRGQ